MRLLEIEPGHYIVPDLVTEVTGTFDFHAEIMMAVGPPATTRKHGPPGDCITEKNGVGQIMAQSPPPDVVKEAGVRFLHSLAELIDAHRTGEPIELYHP